VSSDSSPHRLAVYARASHKWNVRVVETESPDENFMQPRQLGWDKTGSPKYYAINELKNATDSVEIVLETVVKLLNLELKR